QAADIVLLTVPHAAQRATVEEVREALAGKILIDATNPIGPGFTLALGHTTSGGEHVAARARNARVVKAFHTTGVENMADPRYGERRLAMPIAGDDAAAVATTAQLAEALGFSPVPLAKLSHARETEPLGMLWIKLALQLGHGRHIGFALARRTGGDAAPPPELHGPKRTITIVGTGRIGGALARAWLRAGHAVRLAVRDPGAAEVQALVADGAQTVAIAGAAAGADVVVLALPAGAAVEVARSLGELAGTIVIDCTNAIGRGGLRVGHTSSSSEELAAALPGARVVRTFNQQGAEVLVNPMFGGLPATSFVAADDADARAAVATLVRDVGLDAVEVGPLASSRLLEPMTILWLAMAQALGSREVGLQLLRRP
ncbi:MAG TPA: NAD(P)-binding domain-containing protein, partial [Kofleriaceae bacterium]|nr:NAD(P)-binding domain-containing protein [Kofleriaceae bacterium]